MKLSKEQVNSLAHPLVGMLETISEFFKDPQNEREYQEWYLAKYGKPAEDVVRS